MTYPTLTARFTHRPPCTTHTSPSPAGLPYTSRSQLAHPTLRLPPTHLPYTRLPTLHHITPHAPPNIPANLPYSPLPPTIHPPTIHPLPPRIAYPIPIPRNNAQDASPKAKLPRRLPLPRRPKSRLSSPPHPRPDQPTLYPPQPRQVETTPKYRRGNPSKSSNSSTTPVTSP